MFAINAINKELQFEKKKTNCTKEKLQRYRYTFFFFALNLYNNFNYYYLLSYH